MDIKAHTVETWISEIRFTSLSSSLATTSSHSLQQVTRLHLTLAHRLHTHTWNNKTFSKCSVQPVDVVVPLSINLTVTRHPKIRCNVWKYTNTSQLVTFSKEQALACIIATMYAWHGFYRLWIHYLINSLRMFSFTASAGLVLLGLITKFAYHSTFCDLSIIFWDPVLLCLIFLVFLFSIWLKSARKNKPWVFIFISCLCRYHFTKDQFILTAWIYMRIIPTRAAVTIHVYTTV